MTIEAVPEPKDELVPEPNESDAARAALVKTLLELTDWEQIPYPENWKGDLFYTPVVNGEPKPSAMVERGLIARHDLLISEPLNQYNDISRGGHNTNFAAAIIGALKDLNSSYAFERNEYDPNKIQIIIKDEKLIAEMNEARAVHVHPPILHIVDAERDGTITEQPGRLQE